MKHFLLTTIAAVLLIDCESASGVYVSAQESESEAKAAQAIAVSSVVTASFDEKKKYIDYTINAILLFIVFAVYDCARVYISCCARSMNIEKVDNVKNMDKYLNYCTIAIFLLVVIALYVLHKKDSSRSLREDASSGKLIVVKQLSYTGAYVMGIMGVTPFETFGSEWTQGNTGFPANTAARRGKN